jgi:hypothetical protein
MKNLQEFLSMLKNKQHLVEVFKTAIQKNAKQNTGKKRCREKETIFLCTCKIMPG